MVAQYDPAVHALAAAMPAASQNEPIGQVVDTELPIGQYVVALHCTCFDDDEPRGHT